VDTRVSQVDLMPTILSLVGIEEPRDLDGVSLLQAPDRGRTLLARRSTQNSAGLAWSPRTGARSSTLTDRIPNSTTWLAIPSSATTSWRIAPRMPRRCAVFCASRRDRTRAVSAPRVWSWERKTSRGSRRSATSRAAALRRWTGRRRRSQGDATRAGRDAETVGQLRQLSRLPGWRRFAARLQGNTLIDSRAELIRQLEQLASDHPDFAPVHQHLARFYEEEQRPADAAAATQRFDAMTRRD